MPVTKDDFTLAFEDHPELRNISALKILEIRLIGFEQVECRHKGGKFRGWREIFELYHLVLTRSLMFLRALPDLLTTPPDYRDNRTAGTEKKVARRN